MIGENLNSGLIFILTVVGGIIGTLIKMSFSRMERDIIKREDETNALKLAFRLECTAMREEYSALIKELTAEVKQGFKELWKENTELKTNYVKRFEGMHEAFNESTRIIVERIHELDKKIK